MKFRLKPTIAWALSCGLAAAAAMSHAEPASEPASERAAREAAAKERARQMREAAAADYKTARANCNAKSGNDKDVCIKVAKSFLADAQARASAKANAAR